MPRVLIVEDQAAVLYALKLLLHTHGIEAVAVETPEAAVAAVRDGGISAVIQDMNFSRGATSGDEGITLFRALRAADPDVAIVLLTAWASLETAVQLAKEGAVDYVAKPWNDERLIATIRAHVVIRERQVAARGDDRIPGGADLCGLVYRSDQMHRLVSFALQVASEHVSVLVLGPNGVGKEKIAEIVQRNSPRRAQPFVRVDAGALPETLIEAELFGAEPGAFTGATKARIGRFEAADGGTLYLDEIGNLSLTGQMKLLRVLQRGEFERLGSTVTRRVDVRLISATNVNVYAAVQAGSFREDLLYRLNVVELRVPPLGERREDVVPIARTLLARFAAERGTAVHGLAPSAVTALEAHGWPGNVRELENCIRRAVMFSRDGTVTSDHLQLPEPVARPGEVRTAREPSAEEIEAALRRHAGNLRAVASELGVTRQLIYRRLDKLGMTVDQFRPRAREDE